MPPDAEQATRSSIEAAWRAERAKVISAVARLTHDISLAEDCAQDALIAALEHWPADGPPANPAAWLTTAAKNRALDHFRHHSLRNRKHDELALDLDAQQALYVPDFVDALDEARRDTIGDDLLRLMFIACHPVLSTDARVALTLRLLGGLETPEIARAFLVPEPTMAQRIVRAKKTLGTAKVPFELPPPDELPERLASVLEVLYLIFNAGYSAALGADWARPALCQEAIRLVRVLSPLAPDDPEVQSLMALMELQAARLPARFDEQGRPVLLMDQDRSRWDRMLLRHGLVALQHAEAQLQARSAAQGITPGPYQLQAAIAACHARAARAQDTDWPQIAAIYGLLLVVQPSAVIELNRAVAVGMAQGPAAGLLLVEPLQHNPQLAGYPWLHSVRGDLLARLNRAAEASAAFAQAAALAHNAQDRELLLARAARPLAE